MKNLKRLVFTNPIDCFNEHDIRKMDIHLERGTTGKKSNRNKVQSYFLRPTYLVVSGYKL